MVPRCWVPSCLVESLKHCELDPRQRWIPVKVFVFWSWTSEKIESPRNLYAAANLDTLDFFALYSSTAALFGAAGWGSWVPSIMCSPSVVSSYLYLSHIYHQKTTQNLGLTMIQWCSFKIPKDTGDCNLCATGQGNYAAANTCILDELFVGGWWCWYLQGCNIYVSNKPQRVCWKSRFIHKTALQRGI